MEKLKGKELERVKDMVKEVLDLYNISGEKELSHLEVFLGEIPEFKRSENEMIITEKITPYEIYALAGEFARSVAKGTLYKEREDDSWGLSFFSMLTAEYFIGKEKREIKIMEEYLKELQRDTELKSEIYRENLEELLVRGIINRSQYIKAADYIEGLKKAYERETDILKNVYKYIQKVYEIGLENFMNKNKELIKEDPWKIKWRIYSEKIKKHIGALALYII